VYAPFQLPLQLLGAGLAKDHNLPDSRPFLESTNDPQLNELLPAIGFHRAWSNPYFKIGLTSCSAYQPERLEGILYRNLDREHLRNEVSCLIPLLNATVSSLPHCSVLSERFLYGVASELRDLILPGFWRLAFLGDDLVGFIAAFPNITEAVSQACGMADVADLVNVSDALDNVDEGFVAWMGVSPRFACPDRLVADLMGQVFTTMRQRGFKHTWLSWEMYNGHRQLTESDLSNYDIIARLDYHVYSLKL